MTNVPNVYAVCDSSSRYHACFCWIRLSVRMLLFVRRYTRRCGLRNSARCVSRVMSGPGSANGCFRLTMRRCGVPLPALGAALCPVPSSTHLSLSGLRPHVRRCGLEEKRCQDSAYAGPRPRTPSPRPWQAGSDSSRARLVFDPDCPRVGPPQYLLRELSEIGCNSFRKQLPALAAVQLPLPPLSVDGAEQPLAFHWNRLTMTRKFIHVMSLPYVGKLATRWRLKGAFRGPCVLPGQSTAWFRITRPCPSPQQPSSGPSRRRPP